nr:MAG TPA: hypothetical protein [Bacteriophage sp.]
MIIYGRTIGFWNRRYTIYELYYRMAEFIL